MSAISEAKISWMGAGTYAKNKLFQYPTVEKVPDFEIKAGMERYCFLNNLEIVGKCQSPEELALIIERLQEEHREH